MATIIGDTQVAYTKSGKASYSIEVKHLDLHKHRVVKADDPHVAQQKARIQAAQWDATWAKKAAEQQRRTSQYTKQQQAEQRSTEAKANLEELNNILAYTLKVNDAVDWNSLKNTAPYPAPAPTKPNLPPRPALTEQKYQVKTGIFDALLGRTARKRQDAQELYDRDTKAWEVRVAHLEAQYKSQFEEWSLQEVKYREERDIANRAIDAQKADYLRGDDPQAILDYCDLVLSRSQYPDYFPQSYEMDYIPEARMLIVNYELPAVEDLPTLREVRYIVSRDEFTEKHISETQTKQLYDKVLYQITLRTLHELFEADMVNAIDSIGFNGFVHALNPATGKTQDVCVLSVQTIKATFEEINLERIDPKACFKNLKGVGSSKLHSYAAIAPIVTMNKEDKRFVSSYDVAGTLQEGDNLANMPWEDFEHLIRELFEKEFASSGAEVKITRASRDAGVDAIVFDPDPLRGGKFVIQAKRYNNTVGISAVRDLYGTVLNEGAARGILVTTSDYGSDAYEFVSNKPLTLLNGSNLLHMLERHGHKARINLKEAKNINS